MSNIFFTSDCHFGHANVVKFSNRPWTPETQTEELITRWNNKVGLMDDVYHLGDFSFHTKVSDIVNIINQLNGRIHFIRGNHCRSRIWRQIEDMNIAHVEWIKDYHRAKIDGIKVCMFHFPIASWDSMYHGSYHLHGHSHGSYQGKGLSMDVGVDCHPNKEPFSWDEVKAFMSTRKIETVDHHQVGGN